MGFPIGELYAAIALAIVAFWWLWSSKSNSKYFKNIPTPPGLPILGNALDLSSTHKMLNVLINYGKKFGGLVKIRIGPARTLLLVTDYNFMEFLLSSATLINKSREYVYLRPWLGTGLLTSDGPKWRKHRKILTPAFHFKILEQFMDVFESCGQTMVDKLRKVNGGVDIYPYVTLCTLDIICETAMGTSVNAQDNENSIYVQSVKDMCRIIIERSMSPIQMYDVLYPLTRNYYTQKKALKVLHAHSNNVIKKRREEKGATDELENEDELLGMKKKKAFLDLLLETTVDGRSLTDEEIREEVDTFMFEGHDTTASAISFTLYCLANSKEAQDKAIEEQRLIFENQKRPVTHTDLQNMKYLELVIKEALRLYPSVPMHGREVTEDIVYNGTIIPKGVAMVIFSYGLHRDPNLFKDPEKFNPNRFIDADNVKLPYAYIPFSAGPRNCIGQKFAMLEMKSTISKVLRNFELSPASPSHTMQLVSETVLKSANGVRIGLKARD